MGLIELIAGRRGIRPRRQLRAIYTRYGLPVFNIIPQKTCYPADLWKLGLRGVTRQGIGLRIIER